MKKVAVAVFALLLVAGLAFAFWPLGPRVPGSSPVGTVTQGQASFAQRLELGLIYEREGVLDKARDAYEEAAKAEQVEIVEAARSGLKRVLERQQGPWLRIQASARAFLYWMGENLIRLIFVAAAAGGILWLLTRFPRRPGYLLLPFEDFAGDDLGKGLHALVYLRLQAVKHVYEQKEAGLLRGSERLEIPLFGTLDEGQDALGGAFAGLDSFSVGGIDLPLGKLLGAIQKWTSTREHIITGRLHRQGETLWLSVEIYRTTDDKVIRGWELSMEVGESPGDQVTALVEELVFQILFFLCPELEARTWPSFQRFTAGLQEIQRYGVEVTDQTGLERALRPLTEAVVLDPGYQGAHYLLGLVYSNLGRYKEARDVFREVITHGEQRKLEATFNLGLAFYHEFENWANDKAIDRFTEVKEALTEGGRDRGRTLLLALAHCGLANACAQRVRRSAQTSTDEGDEGPFALVQQHCEEALRLAGDLEEVQASTHNALGIAFLKARRNKDAVKELESAIHARPGYVVAYVHLAEAYADSQPEEAIRWLKRGLRWHPDYEYAYFRLGKIYEQQGEAEMAKEAYAQASKVPDARNSLGEILAQEEEYEEALLEFHQVVKLNRRHARGWRNLAWWTMEAGKRDEEKLRKATSWARRALELERGKPYEWLSRDVLGLVLLYRGRFNDAEKELLCSIEKKPKSIQNRYHLAYLYREQGDIDQAQEALKEALGLEERGYWWEKAVVLMKQLRQASA